MTKRSLVAKSIALAAIVALAVAMFFVGKGHTVYLDTNAVTIAGKEARAPDLSSVVFDDNEPEEMGRAERVIANAIGAKHSVKVESLDGDGKKAERTIRIPTSWEDVSISIPALLAGAPDSAVMTLYAALDRVDEPAEKTVQQVESDVIKLEPLTVP